MLLKLFKSNHPYVIFLIPLLGFILWLPSFFNFNIPYQTASISHTTIVFQWLYKFIVLYPKESSILALILVVLQSYYLIRLNFRYIFIESRTYLPSVFFMLFSSVLLPFQQLQPIIIANFFLLFAMDKCFVIDKETNQIKRYFESGLLLGIGGLLYLHFYIFIVIVWLALIVLRNSSWREWLVPIIGFLVPSALLFIGLFFFNQHVLMIDNIKTALFIDALKQEFSIWTIIPVGVIAMVLLIGLVWSLLYVGAKKISARKYFTLFFWFLILTISAFLIHPSIGFETVYVMAIPLSVLFSIFFTESRRNWFLEILFTITFFSVFAIIWLH